MNATSGSGVALTELGRSSETDRTQFTPSPAQVQHLGLEWPLVLACQSLHALGPRALYEFVTELGDEYYLDTAEITARRRQYTRLPPGVIEALVGEDFPPPPLTEVGSYERP